jgi:exopolysaccharide biosynthesis polyprenyl glycosylphosphotransferase
MNIESLEGIPMLVVRGVPLDTWFNKFIKRTFDIFFSLAAIIVTSPIMICVAIGVKLTSPGPVFFVQERVSLNNKTFKMLKFRSMRVQTQEDTNTIWTTQNDPRKTKFGTFLRKTSLDEFPQFFNVLLGSMSIVGPRPERPYWVNKFKGDVPEYMLRHYIKSGITGWAQVNGWRGDTSMEERIKYDNYYIQNWNLMLDIKIIFLTVIRAFNDKNAY